ncbi:MAG: serine hydrolase domain-containing protein [Sphingomicrobium sp.]
MRTPVLYLALLTLLPVASAAGAAAKLSASPVDAYVRPYVDTRNFSGVLLVARDGKPVFARAYGFANFKRRDPNTLQTRFHIASMSMQYTAAAALRLIMAKKLTLDTPESEFVRGLPNGDSITVRHLLTQTSGIRDINGLADYDDILKRHQTPASLVERIRHMPADRKPGTVKGEEHSAYNLLALIIERRTGLPFPLAVKKLVFDPLKMTSSGIDDDGPTARIRAASGHAPLGVTGVEPAQVIHWSAKAGNASAYTTAGDHFRFVEGMFRGNFLSPALRAEVFDLSRRSGFGWFKSNSVRFGEPVYSMNGRSPGFASALVVVPGKRLTVLAMSNVYASFPPDIAGDVAAMTLGLPYKPLQMKITADASSLAGLPANFKFADDFYQSNAVLKVSAVNGEVSIAWPDGSHTPQIPTTSDHYIDRSYGVAVEAVRAPDGSIIQLRYDKFVGNRVR